MTGDTVIKTTSGSSTMVWIVDVCVEASSMEVAVARDRNDLFIMSLDSRELK